jgi:hypothetical protein
MSEHLNLVGCRLLKVGYIAVSHKLSLAFSIVQIALTHLSTNPVFRCAEEVSRIKAGVCL